MSPQLRFPKFTDEWQVKKLGESLESISSGKSNTTSNGTKYSIYGSTGEIGKSATCDYSGDKLLIARVGANAGSMYRVSGSYKVSDNTLIVNLKDDVDTSFVQYSLINFNINRLVFGSGQPLVTGGMLKNTKLAFPSKPEQEKIADFLTAVDERIAVGEKKLELLETYKRGVMQKIFTQQIRFKDESGNPYPEWREKQLGEIATIKTGDLNVQDAKANGKYIFFDRSEQIKKYDEYSYDNEAIIYAGEGSEFLPRYYFGKYGLHQRAYTVYDAQNISIRFLYYFMLTQNNHFLRMAVGSTVKSLRMDCFTRLLLPVPIREEQQKIATFLTALDDKIKAEETRLTAAKQWKKGLLQRMFV